MLTPVGGWIESQGQWDPTATGRSLEDWTQRGTHGRDHYVRMVRRGRLAVLPHRCSLVKITERKFQPTANGSGLTAYLRQRLFLCVREPVIDLRGPGTHGPNDGRRLPFVRSELLTLVTPDLDQPTAYLPPSAGALSDAARLGAPQLPASRSTS